MVNVLTVLKFQIPVSHLKMAKQTVRQYRSRVALGCQLLYQMPGNIYFLCFLKDEVYEILDYLMLLMSVYHFQTSYITLMAAFTTTACLTRTYAIIFGSYKYELTRAQARISSQLIGFIA